MGAKLFEGMPKKIPILDLFFLPPELFGRVSGAPSSRTILVAEGKEALAKRMERLQRDVQAGLKTPAQMLNSLDILLDDLEPCDYLEAYRALLSAAVNDCDADAIARLESEGAWSLLFSCMRSIGDIPAQQSKHEIFIRALEKVSVGVARNWSLEKYDDALRELRASPLALEVLGEEGMQAFKPGRTLNQGLMPIRIAGVLETHLAILAAMIVGHEWAEQGFVPLLPDPKQPEIGPIGRLFQWLLAQANATTAESLVDRLTASGRIPENEDWLPRLGRWRRGERVPREDSFLEVCRACDIPEASAKQCLEFSRHLNFLQHVSNEMLRGIEKQGRMESVPGLEEALYPWPGFLHGYKSFADWAFHRFHAWCEFHRYEEKRQKEPSAV